MKKAIHLMQAIRKKRILFHQRLLKMNTDKKLLIIKILENLLYSIETILMHERDIQ
jgi:hypothetical protein